MELVRGGSLHSIIRARKSAGADFTQEESATIMRCLLDAVGYIHQRGIVHRDLKPENILIDDPNDFSTLKLADFGLSAKIDFGSEHGNALYTNCGTLSFKGPELITKKLYSKPIDIWSCGIILFMLLTGEHPFYKGKETKEELEAKILNPKWVFPEEKFSKSAQDLFLKLVMMAPSKRYTASQAIQHPWITQSKNTSVPLTTGEIYQLIRSHKKLKFGLKTLILLKIVFPFHERQNKFQETSQKGEIMEKAAEKSGNEGRMEDLSANNRSKQETWRKTPNEIEWRANMEDERKKKFSKTTDRPGNPKKPRRTSNELRRKSNRFSRMNDFSDKNKRASSSKGLPNGEFEAPRRKSMIPTFSEENQTEKKGKSEKKASLSHRNEYFPEKSQKKINSVFVDSKSKGQQHPSGSLEREMHSQELRGKRSGFKDKGDLKPKRSSCSIGLKEEKKEVRPGSGSHLSGPTSREAEETKQTFVIRKINSRKPPIPFFPKNPKEKNSNEKTGSILKPPLSVSSHERHLNEKRTNLILKNVRNFASPKDRRAKPQSSEGDPSKSIGTKPRTASQPKSLSPKNHSSVPRPQLGRGTAESFSHLKKAENQEKMTK